MEAREAKEAKEAKKAKKEKAAREVREANLTNVRVQEQRGAVGANEIDLIELLMVYRRHLVMILACFAVGLLLAGGYTYRFVTPTYKATSKLYMVSASNNSIINLSDLSLGSALSSDYAELLVTRPVILSVLEELGLEDKYSYDGLRSMLSVSTSGSTRILNIVATSTDPEEAAEIANCLAEKGCEYLPEIMETSQPNIAERAVVPTTKSAPNITARAMRGGMVGAALCVALLTVLYLLDDTLKDAEDVEKFLGTMPLTVIPEGHITKTDSKKKSRQKRKDNV